jgi:protein TonB
VFENETEDPKPNSKPPYLFLIPVVLGILGFIGYQTVRMGTDTSVERSPYAIDTSVAQAVVQNGVITVHANRARAPHEAPVKHVALSASEHKIDASPTPAPAPSSAPSVAVSATPLAKPSVARISDAAVAEKPHRRAHRSNDYRIATEPVPHIERPIAARLASTGSQANESATEPPDTDVPQIAHHVPVAPATAAPVAAAPAPTAKPVVVAQAPAAQMQSQAAASGPINAADRIVDARMSYAAAPDYPDIARDQGVRGTSVVLVTVDSKGDIMRMSIASSSGNGSLDRAALSAARNSQYVAPKIDGKPAIETYRVTYDFAP